MNGPVLIPICSWFLTALSDFFNSLLGAEPDADMSVSLLAASDDGIPLANTLPKIWPTTSVSNSDAASVDGQAGPGGGSISTDRKCHPPDSRRRPGRHGASRHRRHGGGNNLADSMTPVQAFCGPGEPVLDEPDGRVHRNPHCGRWHQL
jgi:hypothetical protein